jgi:hypothetical protein
MTPTTSFSFSRWKLIVAKHWAENGKRYLLSLLAIAGMLIAWYSFVLAMDKYNPLDIFFQYTAYFAGLYLVGCLFANSLFAALSSKKEGLGYLSLPASHLEKLLCAIFFGVVLFFIAFTVLFYLVDIPMVRLSNYLIEKYPRTVPNSLQLISTNSVYNVFTAEGGPTPERNFHTFLFGYFAIQSAFLFGSVYFTRYSFIKTIVYTLLFILVFVVFQTEVLQHMLPAGWHTDLTLWRERDGALSDVRQVRLAPFADKFILGMGQYILPPVFWIITWFRLKEKEV